MQRLFRTTVRDRQNREEFRTHPKTYHGDNRGRLSVAGSKSNFMRIGPRYKRARRLGADIFEKTQSPKFALRAGSKGKGIVLGYGRSEFGSQLKEKQRARFLYGISERQFARYVKTSIAKKGMQSDEALYRSLETRLDNTLYRLGLAPTRAAARQIAAHGHFTVNGKRVTVPSFSVSVGDIIRLRAGSEKRVLFHALADKLRDRESPSWLRFDLIKGEATVVGVPKFSRSELPFNISAILEFYRR